MTSNSMYTLGSVPTEPAFENQYGELGIFNLNSINTISDFASSAPPTETAANMRESMYPDLLAMPLSADSYLPKDYHETIGRKYDLALLAQQLQIEKENMEGEDED